MDRVAIGGYTRIAMTLLRMSRRVRRFLPVALLALALAGCRSEPDSPEAQIRAWVGHAEQAAEAKEAWALEDLVSERYQDADGLDRRALLAIVLRQFLQHDSIYVFTRIRSIEIEPGKARGVAPGGARRCRMTRDERRRTKDEGNSLSSSVFGTSSSVRSASRSAGVEKWCSALVAEAEASRSTERRTDHAGRPLEGDP